MPSARVRQKRNGGCPLAKRHPDGCRFDFVVDAGGRPVQVEVVNVFWFKTGIVERNPHGAG